MPDYFDLDPEELLSKAEAKLVGRLLEKLERERRGDYKSWAHDAVDLLRERIGKIAEAALRRTLMLERYMVIDATRDDGYLTSKPLLGDLDIAVELARRHSRSTRAANEDWVGRELRDMRRSMVALRLGRAATVSVHTYSELVSLRTPYRVVFGSAPVN